MFHKLSLYKCAGELLKLAKENGINVKHVLYNDRKYQFWNIKALYALVLQALKHWDVLEILINESKILVNEPKFNEWHVRILITELIFGKKEVDSDNTFVQTILTYEDKFKEVVASKPVQKILSKCNEPISDIKVRYVRVNTIKDDVESVISYFSEEGWQLIETADSYQSYLEQLRELKPGGDQFLQDFHVPEVLVFPPGTALYQHHLYKNGSLHFMDKSSCLAPYLLRPHAHSTILDMCAAPGLKTIQLAGIAQSGKVYAVERDAGRFQSLKEMIANSGADNVVTLHSDVTKLTDVEKYNDVEYILLDPTCSGSGMRDRQPRSSVQSSSDKERLYKLQGFQLTLLRFAFTKFPAAKRVVYSTCSLNVEENEEVVQAALNSKHHEFQLVNVSKKLPGWINFGSEDFEFGTKCIYSRPETDFTNGFFVAVFERKKHYSRDDTRSVPENEQDYIDEDINKKLCENGSLKHKNYDANVNYNIENGLDREIKSMRGSKNYINYENNKSEQNQSIKRMHNSNEKTEQYSGHKRFKQGGDDENVNMPETEQSFILNIERKVCKDGSPKNKFDDTNVKCSIGSNKGSENLNISRTKSEKSNESYESGGYEQNVFKKRKESSSDNNEHSSHKRFKHNVDNNIKPSSHKKFDKEGSNQIEFSVQKNRSVSKVITVSQKKRMRQRKLKFYKNLINKTKLTAADNLKTKKSKKGLTKISAKKNHEKDNSQSSGKIDDNANIKLFSKAKLRYVRMKKLKKNFELSTKINMPVTTEIDKIDNERKLRKKNKKKSHIDSQGSFDDLSKPRDENNTVKIKEHNKIKTNISEKLVNTEQAMDISNSKLIKSKKSKKELPAVDEALPEVINISNEENRSKKKKHKKKHPEELVENEDSTKEKNLISEDMDMSDSKLKKKSKKELLAVDETLPEVSNIPNEENRSKKKKHKKKNPEELVENEDSTNEKILISEDMDVSNSKLMKSKKSKKELLAVDETLSEVSNIPNEENRSKKKKHKKKNPEELAENEDSTNEKILISEDITNECKKKKQKR